jgi:hypothetical protein
MQVGHPIEGETMMDQYVVVTRATPVREGGRTIVHVYRAGSASQAAAMRRDFKEQAREENYSNRLEVSVCKVLEI